MEGVKKAVGGDGVLTQSLVSLPIPLVQSTTSRPAKAL